MVRQNPPASEDDEATVEDLTSRTDLKRANRVIEDTLKRLSADLARLSERKLNQLELPDHLREAVQLARVLDSDRARRRQLGLVRSALRASDWSAVQKQVLALLEHGSLPGRASAAEDQLEVSWLLRLVGEGDAGLAAFLGEFPQADRTHLRQLVRSVERASGERRVKAERKLRDAVQSFLAAAR
jgi:ribosome-associated protein